MFIFPNCLMLRINIVPTKTRKQQLAGLYFCKTGLSSTITFSAKRCITPTWLQTTKRPNKTSRSWKFALIIVVSTKQCFLFQGSQTVGVIRFVFSCIVGQPILLSIEVHSATSCGSYSYSSKAVKPLPLRPTYWDNF